MKLIRRLNYHMLSLDEDNIGFEQVDYRLKSGEC